MLSLDEAIEHCKEKAEELERSAKLHQRPDRDIKGSGKRYLSCIECAKEHRQLAEWLRELQTLRENEDVKDILKDCDTCKYLKLDSDDYPCDRCMHRYINQYVYDDKREVNADDE